MKKKRGVSGVLGLIFFLSAFIIAISILFLIVNTNVRIQQGQQELILKHSESIALEKSVVGRWYYDSDEHTLYVNVTNSYTQPVLVTRIVAIFDDGSYIISSKRDVVIDSGETKTLSMNSVMEKPATVTVSIQSGLAAATALSAVEAEEERPLVTTYCYKNITIQNNLSSNIYDYQLKIILDSSNTNFSETTSDMIYFTDLNNNPLYYWIEYWNTTEERAIVWVKIPLIPGSDNTTIKYYYYSDVNPYQSYNDPTKVFIFYEDFEDYITGTEWGIRNRYGYVLIDDTVSYEGSKSGHKSGTSQSTNNDPSGDYKYIGDIISRNDIDILLELRDNRNPSYSGGNYDRVGLIDSNGNGYGWHYSHGTSYVGIDLRTNYYPTIIAQTATPVDITGQWVQGKLYIFKNGTVTAEVYYPNGTLMERASITDTTYSSFGYVYIFGGYDYWIDYIRVRQYVEPSPSYSFGNGVCIIQGKTVYGEWKKIDLKTIFHENTTAWLGKTKTFYTLEVRSNITLLNVTKGTYTGSESDLEKPDGNTVSLSSADSYVVIRTNRTMIYWDEFIDDPFIGGRLSVSSGTWSYNALGYISETSLGPGSGSNEDYAYITSISSPLEKVYVLAKIRPLNDGYHDIILSSGTSYNDDFYEYSLYAPSNLQLWLYNGGWNLLASVSQTIQENVWDLSLAIYDRGTLNITLLDANGTIINSVEATDTTFVPTRIGIGNWDGANTDFDYLYVTNGSDPRYIIVKGIPSTYTVEIVYGSDIFTGVYDSSIPGFRVPIFPQSSFFTPVLNDATIKVYNDSSILIASYTGRLMGGDEYTVINKQVVEFYVDTEGNVNNLVGFNSVKINLAYKITSYTNLPEILVYVYNYSSSDFELVGDYTTDTIYVNITLSNDFVNSTGNSRLRIVGITDAPWEAIFDVVNTIPNATVYDILDIYMVGYNDSITIYRVNTTGSLTVDKLYEITAPVTSIGWNGDITGNGNYIFVYKEDSGLYRAQLSSSPSWVLINDSCIDTTGKMARLEALGNGTLVILYGDSSYCTIDEDGNLLSSGTLPSGLTYPSNELNRFLSSAVNNDTVYTIVYNSTVSNYFLAEYNATTDQWSQKYSIPGIKTVGVTYNDGYIYYFIENGGEYKIDGNSGETSNMDPLPFYSSGPSDRLDVIDNILFFLRADETSELWYYRLS